jgi:hypothetical protein
MLSCLHAAGFEQALRRAGREQKRRDYIKAVVRSPSAFRFVDYPLESFVMASIPGGELKI